MNIHLHPRFLYDLDGHERYLLTLRNERYQQMATTFECEKSQQANGCERPLVIARTWQKGRGIVLLRKGMMKVMTSC
jgi:hypothetical protein